MNFIYIRISLEKDIKGYILIVNIDYIKGLRLLKYYLCNIWFIIGNLLFL